jgi:hypothetical protein
MEIRIPKVRAFDENKNLCGWKQLVSVAVICFLVGPGFEQVGISSSARAVEKPPRVLCKKRFLAGKHMSVDYFVILPCQYVSLRTGAKNHFW